MELHGAAHVAAVKVSMLSISSRAALIDRRDSEHLEFLLI